MPKRTFGELIDALRNCAEHNATLQGFGSWQNFDPNDPVGVASQPMSWALHGDDLATLVEGFDKLLPLAELGEEVKTLIETTMKLPHARAASAIEAWHVQKHIEFGLNNLNKPKKGKRK